MGKPAARIGDLTSDTGLITGPGAPNVLINGIPAARMGDMHTTPMVIPGTPPVPLVGGPLVGPGSVNVIIGGSPAALMGDMALNSGPPATVMLGSPNVLIGSSPASVSAGKAVKKSEAENRSALQAKTISDIRGGSARSIQIENSVSSMRNKKSESETPNEREKEAKNEEKGKLTVQDFVDILKEIEKEKGYQEARFFAGVLDYCKLCDLTKAYVEGINSDFKNDPDIMPTRFMILYGADDSKLREIDNHPDNFGGKKEHPINVANMRKALLSEVSQENRGVFDMELYTAILNYLGNQEQKRAVQKVHIVKKGETLGSISSSYGLVNWKYLYEINREKIGPNPDILESTLEILIPGWDFTSGDEKLREKGADPHIFTGGLQYRYPWVPFSFTLELNLENFTKMEYKIVNRESGEILVSGTIENADEIEELIPDVGNVQVIMG